MKGQWSIAYALAALAIVAWAIAVMASMEPRYSQIDYSQILYQLKLESLNVTAVQCAEYWATPSVLFCNGTAIALTGANKSLIIYHGGPVAVRLSRSWGPINYTLYLAVVNCTVAMAPNGGVAHVARIVVESSLDYLPELYVNATKVEAAYLTGGLYLSPNVTFIIAVSKNGVFRIVDFPVSVVLSCFP